MSTQPEALRLADAIEQGNYNHEDVIKAAAELRRLHAEAEELRGALDEAMWHVKYKELKAVNAELLEALEGCEAFLLSAGFASSDVYAEVCAAITKAGEQARTTALAGSGQSPRSHRQVRSQAAR